MFGETHLALWLDKAINKAKALPKFILSFRSKDWLLSDYPIRFHQQDKPSPWDREPLPRIPPWAAHVSGWPGIIGAGNSKEEAYSSLEKKFAEEKSKKIDLPRPGTVVQIKVVFAPTDQVDKFPELATDFMEKVIGFPRGGYLITDDSSLFDFHGPSKKVELIQKVFDVYGVDVSDIEGGTLAAIFERIKAYRQTSETS